MDMDLTTIRQLRTQFEATWVDGKKKNALKAVRNLISKLWDEKDYANIVEVYRWPFLTPKEDIYNFEVAYSLADRKISIDAEHVYEHLLRKDPNNSSILNNLSLIKKEKGADDIAWELIQRAYSIAPKDEIISRNYASAKASIDEKRDIDQLFKLSAERVLQDNAFTHNKLRVFLENTKKDPTFKKHIMPIPKWKFRILMSTDAQKAESLVNQWLDKGYLKRTGARGEYKEHVYHINPYLESALNKVERSHVPKQWSDGIACLDAEQLNKLGYFEIIDLIKRVRKKYKYILERDLNELFLNYLMRNNKAVVIISGSLVETLLIYHLDKKKIQKIEYQRNERLISKNLFDANLGDLLDFFEQRGLLSGLFVHMGNIARISRNFVHPGKELRETESLKHAKADMCFISALEVVRQIC
jgi:hypothetical protein